LQLQEFDLPNKFISVFRAPQLNSQIMQNRARLRALMALKMPYCNALGAGVVSVAYDKKK
jgi:hypothetical protein